MRYFILLLNFALCTNGWHIGLPFHWPPTWYTSWHNGSNHFKDISSKVGGSYTSSHEHNRAMDVDPEKPTSKISGDNSIINRVKKDIANKEEIEALSKMVRKIWDIMVTDHLPPKSHDLYPMQKILVRRLNDLRNGQGDIAPDWLLQRLRTFDDLRPEFQLNEYNELSEIYEVMEKDYAKNLKKLNESQTTEAGVNSSLNLYEFLKKQKGTDKLNITPKTPMFKEADGNLEDEIWEHYPLWATGMNKVVKLKPIELSETKVYENFMSEATTIVSKEEDTALKTEGYDDAKMKEIMQRLKEIDEQYAGASQQKELEKKLEMDTIYKEMENTRGLTLEDMPKELLDVTVKIPPVPPEIPWDLSNLVTVKYEKF